MAPRFTYFHLKASTVSPFAYSTAACVGVQSQVPILRAALSRLDGFKANLLIFRWRLPKSILPQQRGRQPSSLSIALL